MNIPKIEEAITLLYQTYIEDQDVATQRGIAITAMNEMAKLLGGLDVVKKIEAVPYSARLRAQHLFEDEPALAKQECVYTNDTSEEHVYETHKNVHEQEQGEPLCTAAMFDDAFLAKSGLSPDTKLYTTPPPCPTCEALARTVMMDQTGRDV